MAKRFILIIRTFGDGPTDYGHRLFSQVFHTRKAAEEARRELSDQTVNIAMIIEDDALPGVA